MNRKEITKQLSALTEKHINPKNDPRVYWAREVTFDYGSDKSIRVDYMQFRPVNNTVSGLEKGDFYCFEVKSSVEDFSSKNGHNFIGDYNYYVMPADVYAKVRDKLPYAVGVYVPTENQQMLKSVRCAKRMARARPCLEMLFMMFRSSNRELLKTAGRGKK